MQELGQISRLMQVHCVAYFERLHLDSISLVPPGGPAPVLWMVELASRTVQSGELDPWKEVVAPVGPVVQVLAQAVIMV
jgi:hypothetical protein